MGRWFGPLRILLPTQGLVNIALRFDPIGPLLGVQIEDRLVGRLADTGALAYLAGAAAGSLSVMEHFSPSLPQVSTVS